MKKLPLWLRYLIALPIALVAISLGVFVFMPNALAQDALTIDASYQVRLPLANHNGGIEFQAKNIQVEARWEVLSDDVTLDIDNNGVLTFPSGISPLTAVVTVIVEDNFKKLNSAYKNLAASAIITINFVYPKIYIIAGNGANDVWHSVNGKDWNKCSANIGNNVTREGFATAVLNRKIYIFGGGQFDGSNTRKRNDVLSSEDCTAWEQVKPSDTNYWQARDGHAVAVLNGTFFLAGGYSNDYQNDVWSSPDGEIWSLKTGDAGWSKRSQHRMVSYQGKLYITGGHSASNTLSDVWSSPDGETWSREASSKWPSRRGHGFVVHDEKLYLMGGFTNSFKFRNDVWSSADGKSWEREGSIGGGNRGLFTAVSYKERLYIMGGMSDSDYNSNNNVWSSADGQTWSLETNDAGWTARYGHGATLF